MFYDEAVRLTHLGHKRQQDGTQKGCPTTGNGGPAGLTGPVGIAW
jgi:hypothetical protein